jgi:hypothetical protein
VVEASSNPGGYIYRARFSYQNDNPTTVAVPQEDSRLTGTSFAGTPPRVFLPGRSAPFYVFFDGNRLTWTITSNSGTRKTSVGSEASSTSSRCKTTSARVDYTAEVSGENSSVKAYPNPVQGQLIIDLAENARQAVSVTLFDVQGKICLKQKVVNHTDSEVKLNVAGLKPGLYLVRVDMNHTFELLKIVKE